jgi:hypothetical protein
MHGKPLDPQFFQFSNGIVSRECLVISGRIEHGGGEGDTTQWVHRSRKNVISAQSKSVFLLHYYTFIAKIENLSR